MDKNTFMIGINKILYARPGAIEIIRSKRMMNMKLIERSSKCSKDPNPLSSAMIGMNKKYPISVNKRLALKFKIPKEMILMSKDGEDRHKYDRVLCKKEAIDWWVNYSPLPNEDVLKTIEILYEPHVHEVKKYYSINWEEARIKWGPPVMERKMICMRSTMIDIPKDIRETALKQTLFPEYTVPSPLMTDTIKDRMKNLVDLTVVAKLSIAKQIRILLSNMDPKERYLPVVQGTPSSVASMKHCFSHSNYIITQVKSSLKTQDYEGEKREIMNFIKCSIFEARNSKINMEGVMNIFNTSKIYDQSIEIWLRVIPFDGSSEFKWVYTLYGKPVSFEVKQEGLTLCPRPDKAIYSTIQNKSGYRETRCVNPITYNFKYRDLKGIITAGDGFIHNITTNYTTHEDLRNMISEAAAFFLWGFESTKGRDKARVESEIRRRAYDSPFNVISASKKEYLSLRGEEGVLCGVLTIDSNTEYVRTGDTTFEFDSQYNLRDPSTQQRICMYVRTKDIRPFSERVDCPNTLMLNHYDFKRTFKNRFQYFLTHHLVVVSKVRKGIFDWNNSAITKFLRSGKFEFANSCRADLTRLVNDEPHRYPVIIAFMYCFSGPDTSNCLFMSTKIVVEGQTVDLEANEGVFKYDSESGYYTLYGMKASTIEDKIDSGQLLTGFLSGYRISSRVRRNDKYVKLNKVEEYREKMIEGEHIATVINGRRYRLTKDTNVKADASKSINRQITSLVKHRLEVPLRNVFGKRPLGTDSEESEDEPNRKEMRCDINDTSFDFIEQETDLTFLL